MTAVVGRDQELQRLDQFLRGTGESRVALAVEGAPGIGKTAVWREGLRVAEEHGFRVLACRPAEAEAKMAYAGLADLLSPLGEGDFSELPDPQRDALGAAMLHAAPRARGVQPHAVAAAVLSTLRRLVRTSPVLVAVDDLQWLDRATATVVAYSFRRLASEDPVALLVTSRGESTPAVLSLSSVDVTSLRLGPLGLSALYHVIRDELGLVFPRPTLQRIEEASGGNPLLAIELARALDEAGGRPGPGEPLPVPSQLLELLQARVAKLSALARRSLLAAALLSTPAVTDLERALGARAEEGLQEALDEGLIEVRGGAVRFRHPLIGAAVLASVLPGARKEMHRRLGDVVDDEEKRARHMALGAATRDASVAGALEEAAATADRRGAPEDAAELLELSLQLTPEDDADARGRRIVERARVVARAGDAGESARLLDEFLAQLGRGALRAKALELRAHVHWDSGTSREAEAVCEEALSCVGEDDELRARVLVTLARVMWDASGKYERARAALDLLESMENPDPALLSEALIPLAEGHYWLGGGIPHEVVERGLALERLNPPASPADRMGAAYGAWLKYNGELESARTWLERTHQAALDEGDESSLPYALGHLPQVELWTGNWTRSEALALEHLDLTERTGQVRQRLTAIFNLSIVYAHMGRTEEARARIEGALAEAAEEPWDLYLLLSSRGFLELSLGNVGDAVSALSRSFEIYEGSGDVDTPPLFENYSEALVLAGELETAEHVIDLYENRARAASKPMALAPALRCRALLLAAGQALDEAAAALDEALTQHDRVQMPFSRARTLLVLGQVRRRRGERRAAKEALDEALAIFDELGAPLWAERASRELARIPIRRRTPSDELTPSEERVAGLVAQGLANKEIAQALFMSVKTVESNLTRVYRKLGVRSRSELAARLAASGQGQESAIP